MVKGRFIFPEGGDLSPALEIRRRVFESELGFPASINEDGLDDLAVHAIVFDADVPIAAARMIFTAGRFVLERVCVLPENRHKYSGDFLVRMMCDRAFNSGAKSVWFPVLAGSESFAAKIGFVSTDEKSEVSGHEYITMRLDADKFVSKCGHSCCQAK